MTSHVIFAALSSRWPIGPLVAAEEVLQVFSQLNGEGRTVVLITHEDDVAAHAKRVIRLKDGEVVQDARHAAVVGEPPRLISGVHAEGLRA